MAGVIVPEFKARGCVSVATGVGGDGPKGVAAGKFRGAVELPISLLTAFLRWFAAEDVRERTLGYCLRLVCGFSACLSC